MIRVESYFDREKVENMAKGLQKKTIITSLLITVVLLAIAAVNIVTAFTEEKLNIFSLIVGILVAVFAFYPIVTAIASNKSNVEKAIADMGVSESSLTISYLFKEKRIEVTLTQNGEAKQETVMMKTVEKAKVNKDGIAIYLLSGDMYYIYNDDFIEGNKQRLISLLAHNKIQVK